MIRFGFITVVFVSLLIGSAFGVGGNLGGTSQNGSSANPWLIEDLADFNAFAGNPSYWAIGVHVRLECDPNLAEVTYSKAPIAGDTDSSTRTTFDGTEFSGSFDGNGHTIVNLIVSGESYCGLFGKVGTDGSVTNLGLENVSITSEASSRYVGGLAGMAWGSITNCYSTGSVSGGEKYVGGLTGYNRSSIIRCYSTCLVSGDEYVGGLTGLNSSGYIIGSYSTGSVNGGTYVGGLAGKNQIGNINNCYSISSVEGNSAVGGLTGHNSGSATNCYSTGSVAGSGDNIGGLTGLNVSYTTVIDGCFWNVETSGIADPEGGLAGIDTDGMKGMTTSEMETMSNFIDASWDFTGENANGMHQLWQMPGEGGFPQLSCFNGYTPVVLSGDGTEESPYLINNATELVSAIYYNPKACYQLQSDIDLSGIKLSIAPIPSLAGNFDGNGHVIENVNIEGSGYLGIFGYISSTGVVDDLGVVNCNVSGLFYNMGGLAGYNSGRINNCYSTGSVDGHSSIGGLVGYNTDGYINRSYSSCYIKSSNAYAGGLAGRNDIGSIAMSYSTGHVDGNALLGGFVGDNSGNISSCYSTGHVDGNMDVGGLAAVNYGSITNSYSTGQVKGRFINFGGFCAWNKGSINNCFSAGSVIHEWGPTEEVGFCGDNSSGEITNCFWDTESSGENESDGGNGRTTEEMQTMSTYYGWIFYNTAGDTAIWQMPSDGYPRLNWESSLDYDGQLSLGLKKNIQGQVDLEVFNIKTGALNWALSGHEECGWITGVSPVSGNSSGPGDRTAVTINIDTTGLDCGHYTCNLILSNDVGLSVVCPVRLHVELSGSGTVNDPYLIESLDSFDEFANIDSSDVYWASGVYTKLACDIDLSGRVYDSAVISADTDTFRFYYDGIPFEGFFDGDGHVIRNLTITPSIAGKDFLGLFGKIEGVGATIANLGMVNVSISGDADSSDLGCLCGHNSSGTISNSYATGSITGWISVGGLCGGNDLGTIRNCYSGSTVTGAGASQGIGGVCGGNRNGTIINCYATGIVTAAQLFGGICGIYYMGGTASNCFWDTQSSGTIDGVGSIDPDPAGVVGLDTDEMQTLSTFTDAGWDFVGESVNGSDDVWQLLVDGSWYPRLAWEFSTGDFVGSDGVDLSDFAYFAERYDCDSDCGQADLDGDGVVGILDLCIFSSHWLED